MLTPEPPPRDFNRERVMALEDDEDLNVITYSFQYLIVDD